MGVSYMIVLCTCKDKQPHEMCAGECDGDVWGNENKRFADKWIREKPHTIKYVMKYITSHDEIIGEDDYWYCQVGYE